MGLAYGWTGTEPWARSKLRKGQAPAAEGQHEAGRRG